MGGQLAKDKDQLKNLNFTEEELQKLYKNFSKLDKDKNDTLEPEEFFDIPGKSTQFCFLTAFDQSWPTTP